MLQVCIDIAIYICFVNNDTVKNQSEKYSMVKAPESWSKPEHSYIKK